MMGDSEAEIPETGAEPSGIALPVISMSIETVFGILDGWLTANNLYTEDAIHWRVSWDREGYPVTIMGFDDDNIERLEGDG